MEKNDLPEFEQVPGVISVLKALPYKGSMIYIRRIKGKFDGNGVVFEYLIVFKGEIYSSYIITTMVEGQAELTEDEELRSYSIIFSGAMSTIDTLLNTAKDNKKKH